jgi:hypothetical protein
MHMLFSGHIFARQRMRLAFVLLAVLAAWLCPCAAGAQAAADTEQQMKAGFIYNFALFVEWPSNIFTTDTSPLIVCIAGDQDTLRSFDHLKTKKIKDRPVTVHHYEDAAAGNPCHIIYIPTTSRSEAANLLKRVSGPGVLTIGDAEGFSRLGGIITFYREGNKLRFEINTDAAQRAGLKLSSQLLKLAKIVTDKDAQR